MEAEGTAEDCTSLTIGTRVFGLTAEVVLSTQSTPVQAMEGSSEVNS